MKNLTSTFVIGPCVVRHCHLIEPILNKKFGKREYSVVVFTSDDEADKLRSLCAKLIHQAFPHHTPAERKELRIPGDYDEKWGSIRFRMTMNPYYGKPKVTHVDGNVAVEELPDLSVVCVGGQARVYHDYGGGVMLMVTHVVSQGMTATPFEAPPPKPGQSFMEYLAENHRRE